jgi:nucleoside phosphorylase
MFIPVFMSVKLTLSRDASFGPADRHQRKFARGTAHQQLSMSALGLGRVETHLGKGVGALLGVARRIHFFGPDYALMAAISG